MQKELAQVGDALGLSRKRQQAEVKKRGPSAALRRHCRWIKARKRSEHEIIFIHILIKS